MDFLLKMTEEGETKRTPKGTSRWYKNVSIENTNVLQSNAKFLGET